jgi:hypothetical protein
MGGALLFLSQAIARVTAQDSPRSQLKERSSAPCLPAAPTTALAYVPAALRRVRCITREERNAVLLNCWTVSLA